MLVLLVEDVLGKLLYVLVNLPFLAVAHLVLYIPYHLGNLLGLGFEFLYVGIDGIVEQLLGIERDFHITVKVKFLGKTAQDRLEEGIDGLYAEVPVVMQNVIQCLAGFLLYLPVTVTGELLFDFFGIVGSTLQAVCYTIELSKYALLHLGRCLVGEGNGKNPAVGLRIGYQQLYVF